MLLHDQHWNIHRRGQAEYWLTAPNNVDSRQTPIQLTSMSILDVKSPVQLKQRQ